MDRLGTYNVDITPERVVAPQWVSHMFFLHFYNDGELPRFLSAVIVILIYLLTLILGMSLIIEAFFGNFFVKPNVMLGTIWGGLLTGQFLTNATRRRYRDITCSPMPHMVFPHIIHWNEDDLLLFQQNERARYKGVTQEGYIVIRRDGGVYKLTPRFLKAVFKENRTYRKEARTGINYTDNQYAQWLQARKAAFDEITHEPYCRSTTTE